MRFPFRVLISVLLLPVAVTAVIPLIGCALFNDCPSVCSLDWIPAILVGIPSVLIFGSGLYLLIETNSLFIHKGRGTLAPWDPPRILIKEGPYSRVRNPMIIGVFLMLLGESVLFLSPTIIVWSLFFLLVNLVYILLFEERALEKRYGDAYREYRLSVPAWIPHRISRSPKHQRKGSI